MRCKLNDIFQPGSKLTHVYDFGTSSATIVKYVEVREGKSLASCFAPSVQNKMPELVCIECGQPATHLCIECMIENQPEGTLCDEHTENHPHEDYGEPLELVNSPQMGTCGFDVPAEPPY
jgi:hypothetical protein